jgi:hypothetical protein
MPQLVGLECAICRAPIASVLQGEFCATCGNPIHKRCATPNLARSGACEACGADVAAGAAHRGRSREEAAALRQYSLLYLVVHGPLCLVAGLALLAFGLVSFVLAVVDDEGGLIWIGAIVAGVYLTPRGIRRVPRFWRACRSAARREE